jgi:hypothetical protein
MAENHPYPVVGRMYELAQRATWRVGRKVGRTIYAQILSEPSDGDVLIGVMDTRELAVLAVQSHNRYLQEQPDKLDYIP